MNDMEIVRDFCAEEVPPGPEQLAALRARVVAGFRTPYAEQGEFIFDPHTYRYLGNILRYRGAHGPVSNTLIKAHFADSAPRSPTDSALPLDECSGWG